MKKSVVKSEVLRAAYAAWEESTNSPLKQLRETNGWEKDEFVSVIRELEADGLLHERHNQWDYQLTGHGVLFAEEQHVVSSSESRPHKSARKGILRALAQLRREEGVNKTLYFIELCKRGGIDERLFHPNERVLRELGYVESPSTGHFKITPVGLRLA